MRAPVCRAREGGTPEEPRVVREIVYFNNREGDWEKHASIRKGRVYITLTDLIRHIGGSIIWGSSHDQIEVYRNDIVVKVFPNSSRACVNGSEMALGARTVRRQNRTYVPVRLLCLHIRTMPSAQLLCAPTAAFLRGAT